jgi:hypothetical protein
MLLLERQIAMIDSVTTVVVEVPCKCGSTHPDTQDFSISFPAFTPDDLRPVTFGSAHVMVVLN